MFRVVALAVLLGAPPLAICQEAPSRENAIAVIDRAIEAMGGEEKLKLRKGYRFFEKLTVSTSNGATMASLKHGFGNDYYREDYALFIRPTEGSSSIHLAGYFLTPEGLQYRTADRMGALTDPNVTNMKRVAARYALGFDPSTLKDRELYSVTLQAEEVFEEETVVRIDVEGVSDPALQVSCFFSKRTGLLRKTSFVDAFFQGPADEQKEDVLIYRVYRNMDGVKTPYLIEYQTKSRLAGIGTITGLRFTTELDESEFAVDAEGP